MKFSPILIIQIIYIIVANIFAHAAGKKVEIGNYASAGPMIVASIYFIATVGAILGTLFDIILGAWMPIIWSEKHTVIVGHGCAHYDTNNGKFTWNDNNVSNK